MGGIESKRQEWRRGGAGVGIRIRVALLIGQGPAGEKRDGPYREDIYSDEEVEGAGEDGEGSICDEDQGW